MHTWVLFGKPLRNRPLHLVSKPYNQHSFVVVAWQLRWSGNCTLDYTPPSVRMYFVMIVWSTVLDIYLPVPSNGREPHFMSYLLPNF